MERRRGFVLTARREKLKSQRGASMTFALLLFLVCAVVSSIVIVAATSTSGRFSEMVKMDQRYYSVTSAAGLLCEMNGKETRVQEKTVSVKSTDKFDVVGEPLLIKEEGYPKIYFAEDGNELFGNVNEADQAMNQISIFQAASYYLISQTPGAGGYFKKNLSLTSDTMDMLQVDITATLDSAGKLSLDLKNKGTEEKNSVFAMKLVFSAKDPKTSFLTQEAEGKVVSIKETSLTWQLDAIETVEAKEE